MTTNLVMNGTTFSGTIASPGTPFKPDSLSVTIKKIGTVLEAESGARTLIYRATKRTWTIGWSNASELTLTTLQTLHALSTTWTFVNQLGVSYTVQTEDEDLKADFASTDIANVTRYNLTLTVREA